MSCLEPPDSHHLDAALGWLGLGCPREARIELDQISPPNRQHPDSLAVFWSLYADENRWDEALRVAQTEMAACPEEVMGWLHRSYALRRVHGGGLSQAWDALLPAAKKFQNQPTVAFNLACYACQMDQLDMARHWLQKAMMSGQPSAIRKMALADPDLQALWPEIHEW